MTIHRIVLHREVIMTKNSCFSSLALAAIVQSYSHLIHQIGGQGLFEWSDHCLGSSTLCVYASDTEMPDHSLSLYIT